MRRPALFVALAATTLLAQTPDESFEIEPALLPQNLTTASPAPKTDSPEPVVDVSKLEKDLERARKIAAGAERLFKIGALAKVEAEARALKVVRLEAQLQEARLAHAKEEALSQQKEASGSNETKTNADATEAELAHAIQAAHAAAAKRQQAELEAAEINLFRQQKLLALGSGSKASVRRAEQKLVELRTAKE